MRQSIWSVLAQVLVLYIALVPLFAVWETQRVLGEGILFDLFFKRKKSPTADLPAGPAIEPAGKGYATSGTTIRVAPHHLRPTDGDTDRIPGRGKVNSQASKSGCADESSAQS